MQIATFHPLSHGNRLRHFFFKKTDNKSDLYAPKIFTQSLARQSLKNPNFLFSDILILKDLKFKSSNLKV